MPPSRRASTRSEELCDEITLRIDSALAGRARRGHGTRRSDETESGSPGHRRGAVPARNHRHAGGEDGRGLRQAGGERGDDARQRRDGRARGVRYVARQDQRSLGAMARPLEISAHGRAAPGCGEERRGTGQAARARLDPLPRCSALGPGGDAQRQTRRRDRARRAPGRSREAGRRRRVAGHRAMDANRQRQARRSARARDPRRGVSRRSAPARERSGGRPVARRRGGSRGHGRHDLWPLGVLGLERCHGELRRKHQRLQERGLRAGAGPAGQCSSQREHLVMDDRRRARRRRGRRDRVRAISRPEERRVRHGVASLADRRPTGAGHRADPGPAVSIPRAAIAVCAVSLAGCDSLVGLQDITPDGAPVALSLTSPGKGLAQQPLGPIQVDVLDVRNHPVTGFTGQITLALGNNPSGATLLGTVSAAAVGGTASFDLVGIDKVGAGYTLTASTDGVPSVTSDPINIVAPVFTPVATGIAGGPITGVAVSPAPAAGGATIFAGAGDGGYKRVDGGANWKLASFGADITGRVVADPSRPGVVYEGRAGSVNSYFLKKTVDGGASWHNLAQGDRQFGFQYVYSFALDPANPSVIYTAGQTPARSSDGGTTWTRLAVPSGCNQIAVDQATSDTVYCTGYTVMTGLVVGLYKSTNGGAAWAAANNGIANPTTVGNLFTTPKSIFVYADNMVYRSIDAGASWTGTTLLYPAAMAYAPSMPNRIYLANGGQIMVSNDGGANFTAAAGSVPDSIQGLAVDPTNPDIVYAAGNTGGLFVSRNAGGSRSE